MIPIHRVSKFIFRFGDDRIIPRFHWEGVEAEKPAFGEGGQANGG